MSKVLALEGVCALTERQTAALLKAARTVLMRHDLNSDDDTITPQERNSLGQAIVKVDQAARFSFDW